MTIGRAPPPLVAERVRVRPQLFPHFFFFLNDPAPTEFYPFPPPPPLPLWGRPAGRRGARRPRPPPAQFASGDPPGEREEGARARPPRPAQDGGSRCRSLPGPPRSRRWR